MCNPEISNVQQILSQITLTKGTTLIEVGHAFVRAKYRIKIFNTINFRKSMHYNRATCSPPKMRRTALFSSSSVN